VSNSFTYSVENDGKTLEILENHATGALVDHKWYRITPEPEFEVQDFTLDLACLIGDCDGDGKVESDDDDYILDNLTETPEVDDPEYRYDLNGSGTINNTQNDDDVQLVTDNLNHEPDAKP